MNDTTHTADNVHVRCGYRDAINNDHVLIDSQTTGLAQIYEVIYPAP